MNAQLTEIMRLITNLIRTGVVTEVDRANWLCRVKTGDLETNWINWLTLRAGKSRTWWKPSVGEQVVLFSLGGNLEPAKKESTTVKRKRRTKKQKKEPEAKQGDYLVGTDENVLVLNRTYANRSNAERAAKMQWERLQRGVASFSLQLAEGRADLYTEMPVKVSGFKQPIDDAEWTITTLTHTVSPDNGFTTSLELEVRIDDFEME
ncbi:phage baseplate assembly protein V [Escherichia coli]|nr:phage baseplate assembly protein V [Escherichia coli]EFM9994559.1 phage baseplate assembly protein V [Escherichia coli]HCP1617742.1 phage baseplate assembly protein V [Escherichia coli]